MTSSLMMSRGSIYDTLYVAENSRNAASKTCLIQGSSSAYDASQANVVGWNEQSHRDSSNRTSVQHTAKTITLK